MRFFVIGYFAMLGILLLMERKSGFLSSALARRPRRLATFRAASLVLCVASVGGMAAVLLDRWSGRSAILPTLGFATATTLLLISKWAYQPDRRKA